MTCNNPPPHPNTGKVHFQVLNLAVSIIKGPILPKLSFNFFFFFWQLIIFQSFIEFIFKILFPSWGPTMYDLLINK